MSKLNVAFRGFARRWGLTGTWSAGPITDLVPAVFPVVNVGTPDYPDIERPLYIGGTEAASSGTRFSAVGLRTNGETIMVFAAFPLTPQNLTVYTQPDGEDPFSNTPTSAEPTVRPENRLCATRMVAGRDPSQTARSGAVLLGSFAAPYLIGGESPLVLYPEDTLVLQNNVKGAICGATFVWRVLAPAAS